MKPNLDFKKDISELKKSLKILQEFIDDDLHKYEYTPSIHLKDRFQDYMEDIKNDLNELIDNYEQFYYEKK